MSGSMRFGSVCSGIEAASVAWHPLGWKAAWLSEIEKFPCAVLAHHYPDVPNLGDMTTLPDRIRSGEVEAPDVFCGGTPCQAFSVAGLRKSLDDARGNLSLTFCEIADAIDQVRLIQQSHSSIVFWENVPGVLNTKDNAFGCFLGALAGEDDALVPPGGRWTNAGFIDGPQRAVAWRVLDAQYFGVAQRRRRVFVVASARDDFDPAAVLFEFEGLRRNIAPSREKRQAVAGTIKASIGTGGVDVEHPMVACKQWPAEISSTLDTTFGTKQGLENQHINAGCPMFVPAYGIPGNWIGRKPENDGNATEPMHDIAPCLTKADQHGVAQPIPFKETADCLTAAYGTKWNGNASADNGSLFVNQPVYEMHGQDSRVRDLGDTCSTVTSKWGTGGGNVPVTTQPIAYSGQMSNPQTDVDMTQTLQAKNPMAVVAPTLTAANDPSRSPQSSEVTQQVYSVYQSSMAVRRLTPTECERLQGFPDNYTKIADKTPDGPRYKALGNSWAVPVVRWIGERIARAVP